MKYFLILLSLNLGVALAEAQKKTASKTEKLKQKASETLEATGEVAQEKKDEFVTKARHELANLDMEITGLRAKASQMNDEAHEDLTLRLSQLEEKRKKVAEDLDGLSKSSGRAWGRMKSGFENAWQELKTAVNKASHEFR